MRNWKAIGLSLALFINLSFGVEDLCKVSINPSKSDERTVLLMGGNAWDLFKAYINELKKRSVEFGYRDIVVKVWDGKKLVDVDMSVWDLLTGEAPEKIWQNKLKDIQAKYNDKVLYDAHNLGWDVYCLPEQGKATAKDFSKSAKGECSLEAKMHINLGVQLVQNRKYENALKEFKAAVEKSPSCALAYVNLANLYLLKGDYNIALDTYKEGVKKAGDDPYLHFTGALIYTKRKEYDYAIRALEKALQSGFKDVELLKKNKDIRPLKRKKRKEFCELMLKYNIPLKECL